VNKILLKSVTFSIQICVLPVGIMNDHCKHICVLSIRTRLDEPATPATMPSSSYLLLLATVEARRKPISRTEVFIEGNFKELEDF